MKKLQFIKFNLKNINIGNNKIIIGLFSLLFFYLIYLSIPSMYNQSKVQERLNKELSYIFSSESIEIEKINYSIFPKPHFKLKNVDIYTDNGDAIANLKKVNFNISQKNFLKKNNVIISSINISNANLNIDNENFKKLIIFLKKDLKRKIKIKNSKIFIFDKDRNNLAIASINNLNFTYIKNKGTNELNWKGDIFNLPFKLKYEVFLYKKDNNLFINFKKIKLNFKNYSKYDTSHNYINEIKFLRTSLNSLIKYDKNKEAYIVKSKESRINQTKIDYLGIVDFNPFDFNFNFDLDVAKLSNFIFHNELFDNIILNYITNSPFLNGKVEIKIKKANKARFFGESFIKININRGKFNIDGTEIQLKNIGRVIVLSNKITNQDDQLVYQGEVNFNIENSKNLFRKFLIPKKNRKNITNIFASIRLKPSSKEIILSNFAVNNLDNKILENEEMTILSFQEFRKFLSEVYAAYEG